MYDGFPYSQFHYIRLMTSCLIRDVRMSPVQCTVCIGLFFTPLHNIFHSPVDVKATAPTEQIGDFHLYAGRPTCYKRVDVTIRACNVLRRLPVECSNTKEQKSLRWIAGPTIALLGQQELHVQIEQYSHCVILIVFSIDEFDIPIFMAQLFWLQSTHLSQRGSFSDHSARPY